VKEAALQPIIKILKHYEPNMIKQYINCDDLAVSLLDEIKLFKPSASGILRKKIGSTF
jgi:hypothetical protein